MTASRSVFRCVSGLAATAALFGLLGTGIANAAGCPADKHVADGSGQKMSDAKAVGVTDTVLTFTDLAKEPIGIKERLFRMRKLVIEPGGVVPWHSHGDRPAIIYVISGEIVEYASDCTVPIVHKPGDATPETHTTSHWWKNLGTETVVLLSADVFHVAPDHDGHMM
jgi:quercetin dioxygenase-like cupin family protein